MANCMSLLSSQTDFTCSLKICLTQLGRVIATEIGEALALIRFANSLTFTFVELID